MHDWHVANSFTRFFFFRNDIPLLLYLFFSFRLLCLNFSLSILKHKYMWKEGEWCRGARSRARMVIKIQAIPGRHKTGGKDCQEDRQRGERSLLHHPRRLSFVRGNRERNSNEFSTNDFSFILILSSSFSPANLPLSFRSPFPFWVVEDLRGRGTNRGYAWMWFTMMIFPSFLTTIIPSPY